MTKLEQLKHQMNKGNWRKALSIAAKFPRLGDDKDTIALAHEAYEHPQFYKQLGHDIDALISNGIDALIKRYSTKSSSPNSAFSD